MTEVYGPNTAQVDVSAATVFTLAVALAAIITGPTVAVTHNPLSGWTILAGLLVVAGFALLIELTHPLVEVVEP